MVNKGFLDLHTVMLTALDNTMPNPNTVTVAKQREIKAQRCVSCISNTLWLLSKDSSRLLSEKYTE